MAKYTEHLKLVKPDGNEYYNVEQFNQNSELIDKETKKLSEGLAKVQEGATREKAGIVQLGTEEGKALEGMMLARLAGAYGYGGDIQDEGVKNSNYIYYDRNTRKMYKCLKQNQDISANVTNFIPLDNNSLLERLENLKPKQKVIWEKIDGEINDITFTLPDGLNFKDIQMIVIVGDSSITILSCQLTDLKINTVLKVFYDNGINEDNYAQFTKLSDNSARLYARRSQSNYFRGWQSIAIMY